MVRRASTASTQRKSAKAAMSALTSGSFGSGRAVRPRRSHVGLLRHLKYVIDLNAKISHRALEFAVSEKQLYRP